MDSLNQLSSKLGGLFNLSSNGRIKVLSLFMIYVFVKIAFYKYCFIASPDEFGYVLSSRWFEDALREGSLFGTIFSAHGIYQLFIGVLYLFIGNDDLLLANIMGQLFTFGTAIILYKLLLRFDTNKLLAIFGVVIFLTLPDIFVNGHRYWLDVPAMFFTSLVIYSLVYHKPTWLLAISLLLVLMTKEYVFFLVALSVFICLLGEFRYKRSSKMLLRMSVVFIPVAIYILIVLFKDWLPTNSVLDSIFNDFFPSQVSENLADGNRASSRFNWHGHSMSERLWFKFYDHAFDETVILTAIFGFGLWVYNQVRDYMKGSTSNKVNGEYVLAVFFVIGFSFYMASYIQHMRVFYPFLVPMIFFIVYPFWMRMSQNKSSLANNGLLLIIVAGLAASFCEGGIRNIPFNIFAILAIGVFFTLLKYKDDSKKFAYSSLAALVLISSNFLWHNDLGKNMWQGIKEIEQEFYDDLTPEFREKLNTIVFSGKRVTFDFIFHHYEFLYYVNSRKTQNDKHYSNVTLRPNNHKYMRYPEHVLPSRIFKLESLTNESLDTCRNVFYDSDYFISRNILTMDGILLIGESDNKQIKIYELTEKLQNLPLETD